MKNDAKRHPVCVLYMYISEAGSICGVWGLLIMSAVLSLSLQFVGLSSADRGRLIRGGIGTSAARVSSDVARKRRVFLVCGLVCTVSDQLAGDITDISNTVDGLRIIQGTKP